MKAKRWETREFKRMLSDNKYRIVRTKGSHTIYKNDIGNEVVVPAKLNHMIALRLIKENNLIV